MAPCFLLIDAFKIHFGCKKIFYKFLLINIDIFMVGFIDFKPLVEWHLRFKFCFYCKNGTKYLFYQIIYNKNISPELDIYLRMVEWLETINEWVSTSFDILSSFVFVCAQFCCYSFSSFQMLSIFIQRTIHFFHFDWTIMESIVPNWKPLNFCFFLRFLELSFQALLL